MSSETAKKPIFKRAWFWVIIVIFIIGICAATSSKNNEPQKVGDSSGSSEQTTDTNNEFTVGDVISVDGQEISILSVERNYTPDNEFVKASDGKEYVKTNLQIQNKSTETKSFNALNWEIESSDGVINSYLKAALAQADDSLGSGDLAANGIKKGSIVFEVPTGDSGLKIHFKPTLWSSKEVIIKL